MDNGSLAIITFLWRDPHFKWIKYFEYTADDVRNLRDSLLENLSIQHEFVCISDRRIEGVKTIPLWSDFSELGRCWRRIKLFSKEMRKLIGPRFAAIDLDVSIVGDVTPIFSRQEDFVMLEDWSPRVTYNGSLMMMNAGCRSQVYESFDPRKSPQQVAGILGSDQAWISHCLPNEATFGAKDGIYSYRWQVKDNGLPDDARMVIVHGPWHPSKIKL